jgi:hypothetical protein
MSHKSTAGIASTAKESAQQILARLKELDQMTADAYYEMGQLLFTIETSQMYFMLGYHSTSELIREELSFTHGTGWGYIRMYGRMRELKFSKQEGVEAIKKHGVTNVRNAVFEVQNKNPKKLAEVIRKEVKDRRSLSFTLSAAEFEEVKEMLERHGAKYHEDSKFTNSRVALMNSVRALNRYEQEEK